MGKFCQKHIRERSNDELRASLYLRTSESVKQRIKAELKRRELERSLTSNGV